MNRRLSVLFSAFAGLLLTGLAEPRELQVVEDSPGYNSWPMIQALGTKLVCAYSRGSAHSIGEGKRAVFARTSSDGGASWTDEVLVADDPKSGEVTIGKGLDENGAMLLWIRCWGGGSRHELYRTTDGVSFEKIATPKLSPLPMQITDIFKTDEGLMCLWFATDYRKPDCNAWGTLVSADNGLTWTQRVVERGMAVGDLPTEPSAVTLGDGRILVISRTEGGPVKRTQFQITSTDWGRTWKKARTNIGDVFGSTPSLVYDAESGFVHNYYYERGKHVLKRRVAKADEIFDRPLAWPEPEILAYAEEDRPHDAGNVNATAVGSEHVIAFYHGTRTQTAVVVTARAQGVGRADPEVRVRWTPGGPQLFVDGRPVPPRMLWVRPFHKPGDGGADWEARAYRHSLSQVAHAAKAGVDLVTFLSPMIWEAEGNENWEQLDRFFGDAIAANPNVLLVPRVYVNPPADWLEKVHPAARMVFADGTPGQKGSVSCRDYRAAACGHLRRTIAHLQAKFPANFAGIHVAGQNTGEWFYEDCSRVPSGYDPCTAKAWKAYVAAEGLPSDWGDRVPSAEERGDLRRGRLLLDEPGDRRIVAFNRFVQREMADMVGTLARTCREATKGRKLVLSFYGYLYELCGLGSWGMATSGHAAVGYLIETYGDDLDMLCAPFGYGKDRDWLGSEPVMSVAETFMRNGILWVNEDDTRTYLDTRRGAHLQEGGLKDAAQTYDTLLRNTAQELVRGHGCWWMDLKGTGWFDDAAIWKPLADLSNLDRRFAARPSSYEPEVASIVDEDSCLHLASVAGKSTVWTFGKVRGNLARTGLSYGQYLLGDVCARPLAAKLQLYHAIMAPTDEQIAALAEDRLNRPDLTRVWFWAPGYIDPKSGTGDLGRMERLTGFRLRQADVANNALTPTDVGRRVGFTPKAEGPRDVRPLFAVEDATPEETWATYADGSPAVVVRQNANGCGFTVFYGGAEQGVETLVALGRLAGCTFAHDAPGKLVSWSTDGAMSVQALAAGDYCLRVPTTELVTDALTGRAVGRGPELSVTFRLGEVRVFAWPFAGEKR